MLENHWFQCSIETFVDLEEFTILASKILKQLCKAIMTLSCVLFTSISISSYQVNFLGTIIIIFARNILYEMSEVKISVNSSCGEEP